MTLVGRFLIYPPPPVNYSHLLTSHSTVLLEKLTGFHPVNKFPEVYLTRRFITAFTTVCHLSLSWASSIHTMPPPPTSWRSILILVSHLRPSLPSGLFPSGFLIILRTDYQGGRLAEQKNILSTPGIKIRYLGILAPNLVTTPHKLWRVTRRSGINGLWTRTLHSEYPSMSLGAAFCTGFYKWRKFSALNC